MEPQLITKPAFTVVGLRLHTKPMAPEIPTLWKQFVPRMDEITHNAEHHVSYGVMAHNQAMTELTYMAGNAVTQVVDLPAGMSQWDIPTNTYAVFEATLATIGQVFGYIYNSWLPSSGYQPVDAPYFERYGESFSPDNPVLSIYIPVAKIA